MKYYIQRGADSFGPYTADELREFLQTGRTRAEEWLRPEGGGAPLTVAMLLGSGAARAAGAPPLPASVYGQQPAAAAAAGTGMAGSPYAAAAAGGAPPKRGSLRWLWILLSVLGLFLVAGIVGVYYFLKTITAKIKEAAEAELAKTTMAEERAAHSHRWTESGDFEAAGPAPVPPEGAPFTLVKYPAADGDLAAYLTPDPGDGAKHPAIVWAHGGFGGIGSYFWEPTDPANDQSAAAFREAGIVLMCPSWRGENDNPGRFEMFYGEVDDFLAAVDYCKALPYVDPGRVYIGGHSTGGTLTLLAAASGADTFRAAFSFGGDPAIEDDGDYDDTAPFTDFSGDSYEVRSPLRYAGFIKRPTFYFEGEDNTYFIWEAERMAHLADRKGAPFRAFTIEGGDHFDILAPITALVAARINADQAKECNIAFGETELNEAWKAMHHIDVAEELEKWKGGKGDLAALSERIQASGIDSRADVRAIGEAVAHARTLGGAAESEAVSLLAGMLTHITDEDLRIGDAAIIGMGPVRQWIEGEMEPGAPDRGEEADAHRQEILSYIAYSGDVESGKFLAKAAQRGYLPQGDWNAILSNIYPEDPGFDPMLDALRRDPPAGQVGAAIRDHANHSLLDENWEASVAHPFDSPAGAAVLKDWLEKPEDQGGDPFGAAFALGFCADPACAALRAIALEHPSESVRMEAAWSDCRQGGEAGLKYLTDASLDLNRSSLALTYLRELGHDDAIPAAATEPSFVAKAEMVGWLKHPQELGAPPASIEEFDSRELVWPPARTGDKQRVWLFKFAYIPAENEPLVTNYGMFGGNFTWSSLIEYEAEPTPAELYAHHLKIETGRPTWDDEGNETPGEEISDEEAMKRLREANPGMFE